MCNLDVLLELPSEVVVAVRLAPELCLVFRHNVAHYVLQTVKGWDVSGTGQMPALKNGRPPRGKVSPKSAPPFFCEERGDTRDCSATRNPPQIARFI